MNAITDYLFEAPKINSVEVVGENAQIPINRIFCVGRNYADHAAEMGVEVDREAPFYFIKSAQSAAASGATVPYPPGTQNLHHEMELYFSIGKPVFNANNEDALDAIFGYGCALDMTRRDLQSAAKAKQRPWDLGKNFENSAILAPLTKASELASIGPQRIQLSVNNETKQNARLSDMIWNVSEIICDLSKYYHLVPGDLVLTGTPAGIGPVVEGDHLHGEIDGLTPVFLTIAPSQ